MMNASVKRHVLQKMRDTALVVRLVKRAREHQEPQGNATLRFRIRKNDVTKPVCECPEMR